jgi:hypothetical protein
MRKNTLLLIVLFLISNMTYAQSIKIYGGLSTYGVSTTDFQDFHISDWENYGLKSVNPSSSEGRVSVPLSEKIPSAINLGIFLGGAYSLSEKLDVVGELQYGLASTQYIGVFLGIDYNLIEKEKFSLGIKPMFGYIQASANFGEIEVINSYTPPVILPEGTFNVGETLTMSMNGLGLQAALTPKYMVSEAIGIYASIGYGLSFSTNPVLTAKASTDDETGTTIPMTAKGVVKTDFSASSANISPLAKIQGLSLQLGVSYLIE